MSKFENLPYEIILKIFDNTSISVEDLISLTNVCRRFQHVCCSEQKLWKSKFQQRWPLVWKKICSNGSITTRIVNWRKEVGNSLKIIKNIEEILNSISLQSYKFKSIPSPILSSVFELVNVGKIGTFILLNELVSFINNEKLVTDYTKRYYSKRLLYHITYYLLSKEMKEFLNLPPEKQCLEKGVYYLSKGLHPARFIDYEYEEVSSKLDNLALEVQSYLRDKNSNHSAAFIELFSPEEPLQDAKWSDEETSELIICINRILCAKHSRICDDIHNIYLQESQEEDPRKDRYFSLIYIAVSHRLGVPLQPFVFDDLILFKRKSSNYERTEVLHPYYNTNWDDLSERKRYQIFRDVCPTRKILLNLVRSSFHNAEERSLDIGLVPIKIATAGMYLLFGNFPEGYIDFVYGDATFFCLKQELHLETIIDTCDKLIKRTGVEGDKGRIKNISNNAKYLIANQRKGNKLIIPKRSKDINVKFVTGMIVIHTEKSKPGVVIGWDQKYDLRRKKNVFAFDYERNQPFYTVLLTDGSTHYVAQDNLVLKEFPIKILHFEIGKYFKGFNGLFYEPNKEFRSEYPDDETVRDQLYYIK